MKLPRLTASELSKFIQKQGFEFKRQKGSHMFFQHEDGRTTVIPNNKGEKIGEGLLLKIIKKDLRMERKEFMKKF